MQHLLFKIQELHEKHGVAAPRRIQSLAHHQMATAHIRASAKSLNEQSISMLQPGLADLRDRNDSRRFRAHLLLEEAAEFLSAIAERDEVKTADALGDLLVVILGTALVFDIPIEEVFNEIHKSNMTRSVASRLDRPMMKGPDFRRPDLQEVLKTARSKKS